MVDETADNVSLKEIQMYQFPMEVQEWMLDAQRYGMERSIKKLFDYKEKYHVCSEEYLYLLADSCITIGQTKEAESLMKILKKSSPRGKRAVRHLEKRMSERYDVFDDEEDWTKRSVSMRFRKEI